MGSATICETIMRRMKVTAVFLAGVYAHTNKYARLPSIIAHPFRQLVMAFHPMRHEEFAVFPSLQTTPAASLPRISPC